MPKEISALPPFRKFISAFALAARGQVLSQLPVAFSQVLKLANDRGLISSLPFLFPSPQRGPKDIAAHSLRESFA